MNRPRLRVEDLCLCTWNTVCAACTIMRAMERPMTNCIHCDKPKDAHCNAFGHLVCQGVRGPLGHLTTYECAKPEPEYETPNHLNGYEDMVLGVATRIYVGLAARHPDAEGDHNQAIAVREAKRLINRVVRDARRQDR